MQFYTYNLNSYEIPTKYLILNPINTFSSPLGIFDPMASNIISFLNRHKFLFQDILAVDNKIFYSLSL